MCWFMFVVFESWLHCHSFSHTISCWLMCIDALSYVEHALNFKHLPNNFVFAAVVWWDEMSRHACDQLVPSIINLTCEPAPAFASVQLLDMQYVVYSCHHFCLSDLCFCLHSNARSLVCCFFVDAY